MKKLVSIVASLAISASAYTLDVQQGWQLKGALGDIKVSQFNKAGIVSVWSYDTQTKKWKAYLPNLSIDLSKYDIENLDTIKAGEGFWISSKKDISLALDSEVVNIDNYKLNFQPGWQLKGALKELSKSQFNKAGIVSVWSYDTQTKKWKAYLPNSSVDLSQYNIENLDTIKAGEGFWVDTKLSATTKNIGFVYQELNGLNVEGVANADIYVNGKKVATTKEDGSFDTSNLKENDNIVVKKAGYAVGYGTIKKGKVVVILQKDTSKKVVLSSSNGAQKIAKKGLSSSDGSINVIVNSMNSSNDITVSIVPFMSTMAAPKLNDIKVNGEVVPAKQLSVIGGGFINVENSNGKLLSENEIDGTFNFDVVENKMLGDLEDILNGDTDSTSFQKFSAKAYTQFKKLISDGIVDILTLQYENGKWVYKQKAKLVSYNKATKTPDGKITTVTKYKLEADGLDKLAPVAFVLKMNYLVGEANICTEEGGYKMFDGSIVTKNQSDANKTFSWINAPISNAVVIGDDSITSGADLTNANGCVTVDYKVPFLKPSFNVSFKKDKYYSDIVNCSVNPGGAKCEKATLYRVPETASIEGYVKNKITKAGIKDALVTLVNPEVLSADKIKTGDDNGDAYVKVGYMPNVTYTWTAVKYDENGKKVVEKVIKSGNSENDAKITENEIYNKLVKPFDNGESDFDAKYLTGNWELHIKAVHSFTNTSNKLTEEAFGNFGINLLMPKLAALMSGQLSEKKVQVVVDENGTQTTLPNGIKNAAIYGGFSLGFLYEYGAQNDKFNWTTRLLGDASDLKVKNNLSGVICSDYNSTSATNCNFDPISNKVDLRYIDIANDKLVYSKSLYPVALNVKFMAKHFADLLKVDPEGNGEIFIKSGFTLRTVFNGSIEVPTTDDDYNTTYKTYNNYVASYADIGGANSVEDVLDTKKISLVGQSAVAYKRKVITKDDGYYRINMIPPTLTNHLEIFAKAEGYKFDSNSDIKLVNDLEKGKVSKYDLYLEPIDSNVTIKPILINSFDGWQFKNLSNVKSVNWQVVTNPTDIKISGDWANEVWNKDSVSLLPDNYSATNGYIWFGDKDNGMFSDTAENTSSDLVKGEAITPLVDLTNYSFPVLKFDSWFEVESVDVAKGMYDQLNVGFIIPKAENGGKDSVVIYNNDGEAITVATDKYYSIKSLNPNFEPTIQDADVPYSNVGVGIEPKWVKYNINASGLAGYKVRFVFDFDSKDDLFNGFRGWGIDEVKVTNDLNDSIMLPPIVPTLNTTTTSNKKVR